MLGGIDVIATTVTASRAPLVRPNVMLFFTDDLGYGNLQTTGDPSASTPSLAALAAQGKRLSNWYSGYPVCSASRSALLTGRQPPRVGMVGVINSLSAAGLPLTEVTLADEMRAAGYATLALGKWHQGQLPKYLPTARGFDEFLGVPVSVDDAMGFLSPCADRRHQTADDAGAEAAAAQAYAAVERPRSSADVCVCLPSPRPRLANPARTLPAALVDPPLPTCAILRAPHGLCLGSRRRRGSGLGPLLPLPLLRQVAALNVSEIVEQPTDLRMLTARLLAHARAFVKAERERPFLVYMAFGHVHVATENISPDRQYSGCAFAGRTPRAFHDGLAEVDAAVGDLVHEIGALGLANNTLTLFTSDNGPSLRWQGGAGGVGSFVGASARFANGSAYTNTGKGSTWEGGIRMPALAHWPGVITPLSTSYDVVSTLDVLPSLLHLVGRPQPSRILDGTLALAHALLATAADAAADAADAADAAVAVSAAAAVSGTRAGDPPPRFLPFYNEPAYANASTRIFAARYGRYKLHWITSPGLGGGLLPYSSPVPEAVHTPRPLIYDVTADPAEAFPLGDAELPPTLLRDAAAAKAAYEDGLHPTAIDPAWGYEHAICCGIGCTPPCQCQCEHVPLPSP